jgi:ABC-type transport system substrate-binding protein
MVDPLIQSRQPHRPPPLRYRKPRYGLWGVLGFQLLIGTLSGCQEQIANPIGKETPNSTPQRGGWLHLGTSSNVTNLDAATTFDEPTLALQQLLYAKLIEFSPTGKGFVPDLALSWNLSEDKRTYTFHLRHGALFHDGTEVLAEDIKRSMERALHPTSPNPVRSFFQKIKGFQDFTSKKQKSKELVGVRVLGPHTLAIELTEADVSTLSLLALSTLGPVCKSGGNRVQPSFSSKLCAAGPYRLQSWDPGHQIKLVRFDGYYIPGRPYLDGIEWTFQVTPLVQRLKFESGKLDWIRELTLTDTLLYTSHPIWKHRGYWEQGTSISGIYLNTEIPPFSNVELRRAVGAAIDPKQIAMVRVGQAVAANQVLPPAIPGHDFEHGHQVTNLQSALEHMKKAGFPFDPNTKRGGYPNAIPFFAFGDGFDVQVGEIIQQQLAKIGVQIEIRALSWPAQRTLSSRRKASPMGMISWKADFPDPDNFYDPLFTTGAISEEYSTNQSFFSNKEYDQLIKQAKRTTQWADRVKLYRKADAILKDQVPTVFTHVPRRFELWHPYLRGYHPHPTLSMRLGMTWLDSSAPKTSMIRGRRTSLPVYLTYWLRTWRGAG